MNHDTTKFGYKTNKITFETVLIHIMVFECWGNEKLNPNYGYNHIDFKPSNNHIEIFGSSQKKIYQFCKGTW